MSPLTTLKKGLAFFFYIINKRYKYLRNNKTTVVVFLCAFFFQVRMERKIGLKTFCIFIILCNITVSIISIATPYWIIIHDLSDITIDGYVGLWKGCSDFEDFTVCKAVPKGTIVIFI